MEATREKKILDFTITKVKELFAKYPAPGHSFDHAELTAKYARQIALGENAKSIFLAEMAAYLHDIGRVAEHHDIGYQLPNDERSHHELSFLMLRDWFKNEAMYSELSELEKTELLYAIRNHWNNQADRYETAWILRDADKLDGFGEHGLERQLDALANKKFYVLNQEFRFQYDCFYWIKSQTARDIVARENLMEPLNNYYVAHLKKQIKEIDD